MSGGENPREDARLIRDLARILGGPGPLPPWARGAETVRTLERAALALSGPETGGPAPGSAGSSPGPGPEPPAEPRAVTGGVDGPVEAVLMCDGGSRGNPGPAGAGAVLYGPGGGELVRLARYLGRQTNNNAEYQALILGLEEALNRGVRRITVKMDSELAVKQLNGAYKVKSEGLRPLYLKAKQLLQNFSQVHIIHVRRELNSVADSLANQAMDRAGS